jgi:hypothetical protein
MNTTKPTGKLSWRQAGCIWLILFIAIAGLLAWFDLDSLRRKDHMPPYWWQFIFAVLGATLSLGLWWLVRWPFCSWHNLRRTLMGLAILATLAAIFYAEEDWRGKRAWENCKRELEAKGAVLDWDKYIPPPVPDDQNFFKAPKMQQWFVKNPNATTNELMMLVTNKDKTVTITDKTAAENFLAWSDQFQPDFELMRKALKRPYARMDGDYTKPYEIPIANFVNVRAVAQALAQRAKCDLLLGRADQALNELTLLDDSRRLMERAPTGKPITLVDAMVNVAITGLYANTIADGLQKHAWQEPQLAALQKQLAEINLIPFVFDALQEESAGLCRTAEIVWISKMFDMRSYTKWTEKVRLWRWWLWPRGWTYQNMVNVAVLGQKPLEGFDLTHDTVAPQKFDKATCEVGKLIRPQSPYKLLAAIAIPNYSKALQTLARDQTLVNEAQIVCALERYRLVHGEYPETLDMLVPQFIEKLPHDLIGGGPLHYRRTADGKFLLYSVGWNETDDGGTASDKMDQGDWVWKN